MKSNWKVKSVKTAGVEFYEVYRLRDVCDDDVKRNQETYGGLWDSRKDAEHLAKVLNEEEGGKK